MQETCTCLKRERNILYTKECNAWRKKLQALHFG